jgi:hypothetical protein
MAPHIVVPNSATGTQPPISDASAPATSISSNDREAVIRKSTRKSNLSNQALRNIPDVGISPDQDEHISPEQDDHDPANVTYANFVNCFIHTFGPDPDTWPEAVASKWHREWLDASLAERNKWEQHGVTVLVRRSEVGGKKIYKCRPVMKIKTLPPTLEHPFGALDKFKFRATIAAFTRMMTQGIDYKEKYASTVRWDSIKVLLAIACMMDYDIVLFDISTFFLYASISGEVYMEQVPGWHVEGKPPADWVCRVLKAVYGLPEASYQAQRLLNLILSKVMFPTKSDDCIHVTKDPNTGYCSLGAHVDDLTAIGDAAGLAKVKKNLASKFEITEKVNPDIITGVQIQRVRKRKWLKIHQELFAKKVLVTYKMTDCHEADTPMDPGTARALMLLPTNPDKLDPLIVTMYQTFVGSLIWLLKTRPDLQFTVSLLSRFLACATADHLKLATGRTLRYLKKTVSYGIVFMPGSGKWELSAWSDSDLAGDLNTARSTLGHVGVLGQFGAVLSACGLERKICTSTGQAETYACLSLIKAIIWLRGLLRELGFPMWKNQLRFMSTMMEF